MKRMICLILTVLLIATLAFAMFSCRGSTAYWQEQTQESKGEDARIAKVNGSEKYIVYAALDENGALIANSDTETEAAAYAVVGYVGLVAELTIPESYTDTTIYEADEGDDDSLPVTKVLFASPYSAYKCSMNGAAYTGDDARLQNNVVVTSIVFGENVVYVGSGVCVGMTNLVNLTFASTTEVEIGTSAFAATPSLFDVTFDCLQENVTLNGNFSSISRWIVYATDV